MAQIKQKFFHPLTNKYICDIYLALSEYVLTLNQLIKRRLPRLNFVTFAVRAHKREEA